jgi:tetratricopeptide (TPR) repeat protein/glycosyltransferase involved in cell wall biosynthesis
VKGAGIEWEREDGRSAPRGRKSSDFQSPGREIRRFGRLRRQLCSNFVVWKRKKADRDLYYSVHPGNVGLSVSPVPLIWGVAMINQPNETVTAEAVFEQAGSLHVQGKLDQAEQLYRAILRYDANHIGSLHNLAILCFQRGRYDDTVALTREVVRLRPDLAVAHNTLGVALRHLGRLEEAEACCREALRFAPDYAEAHNTLGDVLTALRRWKEAETCCREALRLAPEYAEAYSNLGTVLAALGRPEEAEFCYREALRLKPGDAAALSNLGIVVLSLGRPEEAEICCREAVRLQPGYAEAHNNLGTILIALGRPQEAEICCREALRLRPGNAEAFNTLAVALSHQPALNWVTVAIAGAVIVAVGLAAAELWTSIGDLEISAAGWLAVGLGVFVTLALGIGLWSNIAGCKIFNDRTVTGSPSITNSTPLLSVGLFVYNGERFLEDALHSILNQTFRDFELIISDNASTDRTGEISQDYARRESRIRYYRSEKNMGAGWNARRVCELATGKYFKWAAADDMLEPEFLRRCVEALESDPACVLAYPKTRVVDANGNFIGNYVTPMETNSSDPVTRFQGMLLISSCCYQIFGVMRMSALRQVPSQGSYVNSDRVLLARMSLLGPFYEVPEHLFISRRHSEQSIRTLPVRLKQPRLFRLSNRHCTLPCPEWWDPAKTRAISFPEFRELGEYFLSIYRAPLGVGQKLRCYSMLFPWIKTHFRHMLNDLIIAADQVLYNLQVGKTTLNDFKQEVSPRESKLS